MRGGQVGKRDEELVRGAWEWVRDVADTHQLAVRVVLVPTTRVGVWTLRVEAAVVEDGRAVRTIATYRHEWPSSQRSTLADALFAGVIQLDKVLTRDPEQVS